jgi:hypothetical protein
MLATSSQTTLLTALMAAGFVLFGIALFQSDVLPDPSVPVPTPWRNWLRRLDILFKPAVFLGTLVITYVCAYDLQHAHIASADVRTAEAIIVLTGIAVLMRAVARNLLASLWRPASEPHLAPILRNR